MDPQQNQYQSPQYSSVQNPYAQLPSAPPSSLPPDHHKRNIAITIVLGLLTVVFIGLSVWLYIQYSNQKNNVDQIAQERVDAALAAQEEELQAEFTKQRESDTRRYDGPSIYGSLNFAYPKLWSVYDTPDLRNPNLFELTIHPDWVGRGVGNPAIVVRVVDEQYSEYLTNFDKKLEEGLVKAASTESNGQDGVRLTGEVGEEDGQNGVQIVLPIRDRTITMTNLSDPHRDVFNAAYDSLKFQP